MCEGGWERGDFDFNINHGRESGIISRVDSFKYSTYLKNFSSWGLGETCMSMYSLHKDLGSRGVRLLLLDVYTAEFLKVECNFAAFRQGIR